MEARGISQAVEKGLAAAVSAVRASVTERVLDGGVVVPAAVRAGAGGGGAAGAPVPARGPLPRPARRGVRTPLSPPPPTLTRNAARTETS